MMSLQYFLLVAGFLLLYFGAEWLVKGSSSLARSLNISPIVIGAAALIRPIPIPGGFVESGLVIDYCAMILVSFLPWVMMKSDQTLKRRDGIILLCCYVIYIIYLVMSA